MTLAISGFWLWGWLAGGIRKLFRREKRISKAMKIYGSVLREKNLSVDLSGRVLHHVNRQIHAVGENHTGIVFDILF